MSKFRDDLYLKITTSFGPIPRHIFDEIVNECGRKRLERSIEELITGAPLRELFSDIEGVFPGTRVETAGPANEVEATVRAQAKLDATGTNSVKKRGGWHKKK